MATDHRQRGAAALAVTLVLFFIMTLVAAYANRNHVFEQRASANQYRSTQAFEAAEAGLEWAVAMLNSPKPIDARCRPSDDADTGFRARYLAMPAATGIPSPATWSRAGADEPLAAACVRDGGGWSCSCPASGDPHLAAPAGTQTAPAFRVRLLATGRPGLVQLVSTGCSSLASPCAPGAAAAADATAQMQVVLGLVPALATAPVAPLTARDAVNAGSAAVGLHNPDPGSGGIVLHSGGAMVAPNARLTTAPGGPMATAVIDGDGTLNALDDTRLFASFFGVDKALWRQHPGAARLRCHGNCRDTLLQATQAGRGHRMIWIEGDLELDGSIAIGSAEHPVAVVATGTVRLHGPVVIHGLVYGRHIEWHGAASGSAALHGAAISEGGYAGSGAPDFIYDRAVLDALRNSTGSFARLPGSWKDF